MATLRACKACKQSISSKAPVCPFCGNPNKKKIGCFGVLAIFFFFWAVGAVVVQMKNTNENGAVVTGKSKKKPEKRKKTKEEIAKEKIQKELISKYGPIPEQSGWDGSYSSVKKYLKSGAHDPSSLEFEACTDVRHDSKKSGWVVGCKYRGKNAFGGTVLNANWFVIKNSIVVEMLPIEAYQF